MRFNLPFKKDHPAASNNWQGSLAIFGAALLIAIFITLFAFQSYRVDGQSMENTLQNNDRLVIDKLPRTLARITRHAYLPHRGDIVVFNEPDLFGAGVNEQLIKRVIGLPGDHVVVKNGQVTIYNVAHPNGYNPDQGASWTIAPGSSDYQQDVTLAANQVFVCGDNRGNSTDSRAFGPINANQIIGKLVYRIAPLGERQRF